ncbi:unnamed protein product [Rangifer tarandus platyrhynchus]|uniref:Uncharacterized protein n=1 Tax=Rangifer tarandus platyrhynchus TaxID=3082113 RepID=A0ABN8ZX08_RANTA|nr:unnamed protein product [Rangifer tarandus platyrhynchus]
MRGRARMRVRVGAPSVTRMEAAGLRACPQSHSAVSHLGCEFPGSGVILPKAGGVCPLALWSAVRQPPSVCFHLCRFQVCCLAASVRSV